MASVAAPAVTRWSESFVSLRGVGGESYIIDDVVVKAVVDVQLAQSVQRSVFDPRNAVVGTCAGVIYSPVPGHGV